jgi:hypothetical protein
MKYENENILKRFFFNIFSEQPKDNNKHKQPDGKMQQQRVHSANRLQYRGY